MLPSLLPFLHLANAYSHLQSGLIQDAWTSLPSQRSQPGLLLTRQPACLHAARSTEGCHPLFISLFPTLDCELFEGRTK